VHLQYCPVLGAYQCGTPELVREDRKIPGTQICCGVLSGRTTALLVGRDEEFKSSDVQSSSSKRMLTVLWRPSATVALAEIIAKVAGQVVLSLSLNSVVLAQLESILLAVMQSILECRG
jgi:hypothetical protein